MNRKAIATPIIMHIIIRVKLNSRKSFLEIIVATKKTRQKPRSGGNITYRSHSGRYWINWNSVKPIISHEVRNNIKRYSFSKKSFLSSVITINLI